MIENQKGELMIRRWIGTAGLKLSDAVQKMELLRLVFKIVWHFAAIPLSYWLAFLFRFDGVIPIEYQLTFWHSVPILMVICLLSFLAFRLFSDVWAYFSVDDLVRMTTSIAVGVGVFAMLIYARPVENLVVPRSVIVMEFILLSLWVGGGRLGARYIRRFRGMGTEREQLGQEKLLLIGTLEEADRLIRESHRTGLGKMVGVAGEDCQAQNIFLNGIQMPHRNISEVEELVRKVKPDTILIMPPYNRPRQINEIMESVSAAGIKCKFRKIPSLSDLATGQLKASSIRNVDIEDLLERGKVEFDRGDIRRFLKGKNIMITGAGGSIGSEIVRQVCGYEPETVILFEQSEFGLYSIEQELQLLFPNLNVIAVAGDVRQKDLVRHAFDLAGRVDVVYHAAAYKHVPLMEKNVPVCFQTNVLGTACMAKEAVRAGVERFVLISSDKAVRPTSIMGGTKRLAERIIGEMDAGTTTFVSVRFGNVLGSSGSVVPLFKRQIAAGGPVTVTSEGVRRFFMTIPEAVDLVLQAGKVGRHQEVMVLEMGEMIKIIDLARRLIELSGLTPGEDIEVRITGMRPGEKEYEEVYTQDENVLKTAYEKIWVIKKNSENQSLPSIDLDELADLVERNEVDKLRELLVLHVPENCFNLNGS